MPPRYLYQYSPANKKTINNLATNCVWFSKPINFNDPFDCDVNLPMTEPVDEELLGLCNYIRGQERDKDTFDQKFLDLDGQPNLAFRNYLVIRAQNEFDTAQRKILTETGIVCLSTVPFASWSTEHSSVLMWSHYTHKHTGFCLEFDTTYEPFYNAAEVNYADDVHSVTVASVIYHQEKALLP